MPDVDLVAAARAVVEGHAALGTTVAVAESCTGGLVCAALTAVPGSSAVLLEGYVTYSNAAKVRALGVKNAVIDTFGAVSPATAWAMALGALRASGADRTVAITGIAGPGGGSEDKPVGLVVFGRAWREGGEERYETHSVRFTGGDRAAIRAASAHEALALLDPARQPGDVDDRTEALAP